MASKVSDIHPYRKQMEKDGPTIDHQQNIINGTDLPIKTKQTTLTHPNNFTSSNQGAKAPVNEKVQNSNKTIDGEHRSGKKKTPKTTIKKDGVSARPEEEIVYFDISDLRKTLQSRWRHAAYRHRVSEALLELHTTDSLNASLNGSFRSGATYGKSSSIVDTNSGTSAIVERVVAARSSVVVGSPLAQSIEECIAEIRDGLDPNPWHDALRFVCLDLPTTPSQLLKWMDSLAEGSEASDDEAKRILGHLPPVMRSHPDTTDFLEHIVLPFRSYVMACVVAHVFQQLAVSVSSSNSFTSSRSGSFRRRLSHSNADNDNNLTPSSSVVNNPVSNRNDGGGQEASIASSTIIPLAASSETDRKNTQQTSTQNKDSRDQNSSQVPTNQPPAKTSFVSTTFKEAADTSSYDMLFEELQNELDLLGVGDEQEEEKKTEEKDEKRNSILSSEKLDTATVDATRQKMIYSAQQMSSGAGSPSKQVKFEIKDGVREISAKPATPLVDTARSVSPPSALKATSSFPHPHEENSFRSQTSETKQNSTTTIPNSVNANKKPTLSQIHAAQHAASLAEVFHIDSMIPDHGDELIRYAHEQFVARKQLVAASTSEHSKGGKVGDEHNNQPTVASSAYLRYHLNYFNSTEEWDDTKFIQTMMPLASKGLAHAEFDVGMCFASLKDTHEAMAWLTRAANSGHTKAIVVLAQMHLTAAFEADNIFYGQTGGGAGLRRRRRSSNPLAGGSSSSSPTTLSAGDMALKAAAKLISGRLTTGDSEADEDEMTQKIVKKEAKRDRRRKKRFDKQVKRIETKGLETDKKNAKIIAAMYRKKKSMLNSPMDGPADATYSSESTSDDGSTDSDAGANESGGSTNARRKNATAPKKKRLIGDVGESGSSGEDDDQNQSAQSSVISTIAESLDRRRKEEKGFIAKFKGSAFGRRKGFFSLGGGGAIDDNFVRDDEGVVGGILRKTRKILHRMCEGHALDDDDAIARRIGLVVKDSGGKRIDTNAKQQTLDRKRRQKWRAREDIIRAKTKYHLRKCFQIAKIALRSPDWDAESARDRQRAEALLSMLEEDAMLALKEKGERETKKHRRMLVGFAATLATLFVLFLCLVSYYVSGKMTKPGALKVSRTVKDAYVNPYVGLHSYPEVEAGVRRAGAGDPLISEEPTHAVHKEDSFSYRPKRTATKYNR